jgi:hypothetical protein
MRHAGGVDEAVRYAPVAEHLERQRTRRRRDAVHVEHLDREWARERVGPHEAEAAVGNDVVGHGARLEGEASPGPPGLAEGDADARPAAHKLARDGDVREQDGVDGVPQVLGCGPEGEECVPVSGGQDGRRNMRVSAV